MGSYHLPPPGCPQPQSPSKCRGVFPVVLSLASSEESCSGVCGHVCMCDTREWLAGASTLMGNKLWMGGEEGRMPDSVQLCCSGKEPIVTSLRTDEFGYPTLEDTG